MVRVFSFVRWIQVRACSLGRAWRHNSCMRMQAVVLGSMHCGSMHCSGGMHAQHGSILVCVLCAVAGHETRACAVRVRFAAWTRLGWPLQAAGAPVSVSDGPFLACCEVVRRGNDAQGGARSGLAICARSGLRGNAIQLGCRSWRLVVVGLAHRSLLERREARGTSAEARGATLVFGSFGSKFGIASKEGYQILTQIPNLVPPPLMHLVHIFGICEVEPNPNLQIWYIYLVYVSWL
jgi:hypothetical protein